MKRLFTTLLTAACASVPLALTPAGTVQAQSVTRPVQDRGVRC
jgi:hypothetical protein